jgi:hypothetical protein
LLSGKFPQNIAIFRIGMLFALLLLCPIGSDGVVNQETLMRFALAFAMLVGFASGAEAALVVNGGLEEDGLRSSPIAAGYPGQPSGVALVQDWSTLGAGPKDNPAPQWPKPQPGPVASPAHSLPKVSDTGLDNVELSAVPDAASWGLLLAGFGLVGVVTRRRRDARSVAA